MNQEIERIIDQLINEEEFIYLVEFKMTKEENKNLIEVFIDTDEGVTLDQCSRFSKKFAAILEEKDLFGEEQYVIEVSSPGLTSPILKLRQYVKAIGKELEITFEKDSESVSKVMTLTKVDDDELTLESKKDKETIKFENIVKATYHLKW